MSEKKIVSREFRHANYSEYGNDDLLTVKEILHFDDGTSEPNLRLVRNYKRYFYLTKPGFRNHNDKKEWEHKDRLLRYGPVNQARLPRAIANALNITPSRHNLNLRTLARSQYLYGTDISTSSLMRNEYRQRFPNPPTPSTLAVIDIETDVVEGHGDIEYISITYKDKIFLATTKAFMKGIDNPHQQMAEKIEELIGDKLRERNAKVEFAICDDPAQACFETIQRAHQWKPDFVGIFNINFDLPKICDTLVKGGYDLADVFSDPSVPKEYRFWYYRKDEPRGQTGTGKDKSKHDAELWHKAKCHASFWFCCLMATHNQLRKAKGKEPSYALDYLLKKYAKTEKLVVKDAPEYIDGIDWHVWMQRNMKIVYGVYNIWDCVSCEIKDEMTGDIATAMPTMAGDTDYDRFPSLPKRSADKLHFVVLKKDRVIASTSDQMKTEADKDIIGIDGWIVTLPPHNVNANTGIRPFRDAPHIKTLIHGHAFDIDCISTYPTTGEIANISKETTKSELCMIEGIEENVQRMAGINITGGRCNSLEICGDLLNFPSLFDIHKEFKRQRRINSGG